MNSQLRGKLESAALRLDHFLDSLPPERIGRHESMLLFAASEIAQALEILDSGGSL